MEKTEEITVEFPGCGKSVRVRAGGTAFRALAKAGVGIQAECGGRGKCGKCRIRVEGVADPLTELEKALLSAEDADSGVRLACLCKLWSDSTISVETPSANLDIADYPFVFRAAPGFVVDSALKAIGLDLTPPGGQDRRADLRRITDALPCPATGSLSRRSLSALAEIIRKNDFKVTSYVDAGRLLEVTSETAAGGPFGAGIDVGTTSICVSIADLSTGEIVASAMSMNPQRMYGADVASRINFAKTERNGLEKLRRLVIDKVQSLIEYAAAGAGIGPDEIRKLTLVGNPTMTHIFLGVDPAWIAPAPYIAPTTTLLDFRASDIGIKIGGGARLSILPAAAAYIGADALAAGLRMRLHESGATRLLIDLGTNAEILLSIGDTIYACSAAAGPALEGAHIKCGITARSGAISEVLIDDTVHIKTIDNAPPAGLCGTGLLDSIAGLLEKGIINPSGRLGSEIPDHLPVELTDRLIPAGPDTEYTLTASDSSSTGNAIVLTQKDVREVQLAKGAIRAGVEFLLEEANLSLDNIDKVYLAGALGTHLRPGSVLRVGLLPPVAPEKISFVGNAALDGALEALLSEDILRAAEAFADKIHYIELSALKSFTDRFVESMRFSTGVGT